MSNIISDPKNMFLIIRNHFRVIENDFKEKIFFIRISYRNFFRRLGGLRQSTWRKWPPPRGGGGTSLQSLFRPHPREKNSFRTFSNIVRSKSKMVPKWFLIMSNIISDAKNMFPIVRNHFRVETDDFGTWPLGGRFDEVRQKVTPPGGVTARDSYVPPP